MSAILSSLERQAGSRPDAEAIRRAGTGLSYAQLQRAVENLAACLPGRVVGLLINDGLIWVIADLAAQKRAVTCVPLPSFFTDRQLTHVLNDAGVDVLITDDYGRAGGLCAWSARQELPVLDARLVCLQRSNAATPRHVDGIAKITYTSGTTGAPKGVCLRQDVIDRVAMSLNEVVGTLPQDRALSLLPLTLLLENIACLYAPLLAGAGIVLPRRAHAGIAGSDGDDVSRLLQCFNDVSPTAVVLVPQLLLTLITAVEVGHRLPATLRFVAVGGAPVSPTLLERAAGLGMPVYEGYGLSEACSVVCLNSPAAHRRGTVGRPLPHVDLRIAGDGEVLVRGAMFDGYVGEPRRNGNDYWPTGDLGAFDADGYLAITGRKKSAYATAFGRNVAPEWVERELLCEPAIVQAAVFGEARPYNIAVLVPNSGVERTVMEAVRAANRRLPDYARVRRYLLAGGRFTPASGELTANGRLRRRVIWNRYRDQIHRLYEGANEHVVL